MAREILFKAKRLDNGEWVEGYYAVAIDKRGLKQHNILVADHHLGYFKWFVIDEKTLCQYTGLNDKNGNKIWENDVVIGREGYCGNPKIPTRELKFVVTYSHGHYRWLDNSDMYEFEVIGTIFDNPELLGGGE